MVLCVYLPFWPFHGSQVHMHNGCLSQRHLSHGHLQIWEAQAATHRACTPSNLAPFGKGGCFANFLHARTHLPMGTRLVQLLPNRWHPRGVTREQLPTSLPVASFMVSVYDSQLIIRHAAELMQSQRGYRCPGSAGDVLPTALPVLEETPDYRRKDSRSQPFISLIGIWNKNSKETLGWSRLRSLICLFKL